MVRICKQNAGGVHEEIDMKDKSGWMQDGDGEILLILDGLGLDPLFDYLDVNQKSAMNIKKKKPQVFVETYSMQKIYGNYGGS